MNHTPEIQHHIITSSSEPGPSFRHSNLTQISKSSKSHKKLIANRSKILPRRCFCWYWKIKKSYANIRYGFSGKKEMERFGELYELFIAWDVRTYPLCSTWNPSISEKGGEEGRPQQHRPLIVMQERDMVISRFLGVQALSTIAHKIVYSAGHQGEKFCTLYLRTYRYRSLHNKNTKTSRSRTFQATGKLEFNS